MPKIKISATRIKSWFQYRCERKFIYSAIIPRNTEDSKQKVQHEYSFIEKKPEDQDRSWADAGNVFEDNLIVKQLKPTPQNACFERNTDPEEEGVFASVSPKRTEAFFTDPSQPSVKYLFQGSLSVVDDFWVHVLNLPLETLYNDFSFSIVHPDIIKREVTQERGRSVITITVIDVKATGKAMLFHRAQVAFYTLLVEGLIRYWTRRGIIDKRKVLVRVSNVGSIWHMDDNANAVEDGTYLEDDFRLQAYQYMVKEFMTNELLEFPKRMVSEHRDTTNFHVYFKCEQCDYLPHCIKSIDLSLEKNMDISAISKMSGQAKQALRSKDIIDLDSLISILGSLQPKDLASNALQRNQSRYIQQAKSLINDEIFLIDEQLTLQMPPHIDCHIYILTDRNPITNTLATLGCGIAYRGQKIEIHSRVIENRSEEQQAIIDILTKVYVALEKIDLENQSGAKKIVHIFTYEPSEASDLQQALARSIENKATSNIILQFARMFPPDDFMPEPEFKGVNHLPGCSLQRVIQDVFALPIRVSYDIARVSQTIKRLSEPSLRAYEPKDDFQSSFSSRLAIAICNEIATNLTDTRKKQVQQNIADRIIATHDVAVWIEKQNHGRITSNQEPFLRLQKSPFMLHGNITGRNNPQINALAVQALLEKKSEVLQCLFRLTQSQKLRVHNFQCIDDMKLQDARVFKTFTFLDFQCPKKFAHVDMSEGSMDLLLTDGNHDILLHPEEWPLDAEFWDAKYYVTLEKTEVRDNAFFITIKMLTKQWKQGPYPAIYSQVESGKAQWVLDKGVRDWTLRRLPAFFEAIDQ